MKTCILLLLYLPLVQLVRADEQSALKVYSQHDYRVLFTKGWWSYSFLSRWESEGKDEKSLPSESATGSTSAVLDFEGGKVLVTAEHVVRPNLDRAQVEHAVTKVIENGCWVKSIQAVDVSTKVLLGGLAIEPESIARVGSDGDPIDIVFLRVTEDAVFRDLKVLSIAHAFPTVNEKVTIIGFPSTSNQQIDTGVVSATNEKQGHFVLNRAVPSGYSGGVVLNSHNEVYGVISSTSQNQTTVLRITAEMMRSLKWEDFVFIQKRTVSFPK